MGSVVRTAPCPNGCGYTHSFIDYVPPEEIKNHYSSSSLMCKGCGRAVTITINFVRCDICRLQFSIDCIFPFEGLDYCKDCLDLEMATRPSIKEASKSIFEIGPAYSNRDNPYITLPEGETIIRFLPPKKDEVSPMSGPTRLPDDGRWINRFKIRSETSNAEYTVAQDKFTLLWGCSCKGWVTKRPVNGVKPHCKHLKAIVPEAEKVMPKRGNVDDWKDAFRKSIGGSSPSESGPLVIKEKGKRRFSLDD